MAGTVKQQRRKAGIRALPPVRGIVRRHPRRQYPPTILSYAVYTGATMTQQVICNTGYLAIGQYRY